MLPIDIADANEAFEENPLHTIEEQREREWQEFTEAADRFYRWSHDDLDAMLMCIGSASNPAHEFAGQHYGEFGAACRDFADREKWSGVLTAVARLLKDKGL